MSVLKGVSDLVNYLSISLDFLENQHIYDVFSLSLSVSVFLALSFSFVCLSLSLSAAVFLSLSLCACDLMDG